MLLLGRHMHSFGHVAAIATITQLIDENNRSIDQSDSKTTATCLNKNRTAQLNLIVVSFK